MVSSTSSLNVNTSNLTYSSPPSDQKDDNSSASPIREGKLPVTQLTPRHTAKMMMALFNEKHPSSAADDDDEMVMYHHMDTKPGKAKNIKAAVDGVDAGLKLIESKWNEILKNELGGNTELTDEQCMDANRHFEVFMSKCHDYMTASEYPLTGREAKGAMALKIRKQFEKSDFVNRLTESIFGGLDAYQKRIASAADNGAKNRYYQHLSHYVQTSQVYLTAMYIKTRRFRSELAESLATISERMLQIPEPAQDTEASKEAGSPEKPDDSASERHVTKFSELARQQFVNSAVRWKAHAYVFSELNESTGTKADITSIDWLSILSDSGKTEKLQNTLEAHFLRSDVDLSLEKYNYHTQKIREGFNSFFLKEKSYVEKKEIGEIFKKFYDKFKSVLVKGKQSFSESSSLNERVEKLRQELESYFVKPSSTLEKAEFDQLFKKFKDEFHFHFAQSEAILSPEEFNDHFSDFVNSEKEQAVTLEMMEERDIQQGIENSLT